MYVLCAGMYRACSTWQYEVIAHLLERHHDARRLGYLTGEEFAERDAKDGGLDGWYILKSHEGHARFSQAVAEGRAIVVYAHRDIRDVVFSLMHKRGLTFEEITAQGMVHQILVNDRFWSRLSDRLTQRYDRLVADPATGVAEIAAHLRLNASPAEIAEVAAEYSFQTNRRRTIELGDRLRAQGIDLEDPANRQYYDQKTLLHWNHLREGRPGNWRELATAEQRAVLSRLCDPWLIAHGYEADTVLPSAPAAGFAQTLVREVELARAWSVCALRCASLRYPQSARRIKRLLGIAAESRKAVPQRAPGVHRVDDSSAAGPSPSMPAGRPDRSAVSADES